MLYVASSSQSIVYPINGDISLFCFDLKLRVKSTGQLEPNFQWILFTSHFRVEFLESEKKKKLISEMLTTVLRAQFVRIRLERYKHMVEKKTRKKKNG